MDIGAPWKERAIEKLASRNSQIPTKWQIPSVTFTHQDDLDSTKIPAQHLAQFELDITEAPINVLQRNLGEGMWKAEDVCRAYLKRATLAHQLTNCLTEVFFDRAIAKSQSLDEHLQRTGRVVGPLHGIPISLKDQINVEGIETTIAYISQIGKKASKNAVIVDILEDCGAILFAKTNLPQTMMWVETNNNLFGRTVNAHNRLLTSGGSSGGEGSLVAMHGSALGIGTDVGGSIRVPSSFGGLYGLRPSFHRLPMEGVSSQSETLEGQEGIYTVVGPICSTFYGIKLLVQSILTKEPWLKDPSCIRKPWDEGCYRLSDHGKGEGPLCFGIMWDDGFIRPHPPVIRALECVKKAVERVGHKVIVWKPLKHHEKCETLRKIWASAPLEVVKAPLQASGEPRLNLLNEFWIPPKATKPSANKAVPAKATLTSLWELNIQRRAQQVEYLKHWQSTKDSTGTGRPVDAILAPIAPYAPPPHGNNFYANYTTIWNTLNYPALAIPVTKVDPSLDEKKPPHTFYNTVDKKNYDFYDPGLFKKAPVGIQLIAKTLEEEALIGMAEIVEHALQEEKLAKL